MKPWADVDAWRDERLTLRRDSLRQLARGEEHVWQAYDLLCEMGEM